MQPSAYRRLRYRFFRFIYAIEQARIRRLTPSGLIFVSCLAITAAILDGKQSMAYQIFCFLFAILLISLIYSRSFRCSLQAVRILPRFGTVGTPVTYRVILHNPSRQPQTGLRLTEHFADPRPTYQEWLTTPEPGEDRRNAFDRTIGYYRWIWLLRQHQRASVRTIDLPPLPPHSRTEVTLTLTPYRRGLVRFQGMTLSRPDPFGLFNACHRLTLPQSLWLLPQRYQLPDIILPGLRRYQSGGVALASSVGDSEEFHSLREYRPGDALRKIHWKSWAKRGIPIVREEQDEFFVRHALILDTFQPQAYSDTLEAAVAIATSLACDYQTQESLLDIMFVGLEAYCFTTGRGVGHTDQILEILASVVACRDRSFAYLTPLVLERADLLSGCICILLAWDDDRRQLVQTLHSLRLPTRVWLIGEPANPDPALAALGVQIVDRDRIQESLVSL